MRRSKASFCACEVVNIKKIRKKMLLKIDDAVATHVRTLDAEKNREKFIEDFFLFICGVGNGGGDVFSVRFRAFRRWKTLTKTKLF